MCCDLCEEWFHPKCQGLTVDAFRAVGKYDFIWLCVGCKPNFVNVLKIRQQIDSKIEEVEKKIIEALEAAKQQSKECNKKLEDKISSIEKTVTHKISEQQAEVEKAFRVHKEYRQCQRFKQLQKSTQVLKQFVKKKEDKEAREVNIIVGTQHSREPCKRT